MGLICGHQAQAPLLRWGYTAQAAPYLPADLEATRHRLPCSDWFTQCRQILIFGLSCGPPGVLIGAHLAQAPLLRSAYPAQRGRFSNGKRGSLRDTPASLVAVVACAGTQRLHRARSHFVLKTPLAGTPKRRPANCARTPWLPLLFR